MNDYLRIPFDLIETDIDLSSVNVVSGQSLVADIEQESYRLFREAVDAIKVIRSKYVSVVATSFGKDSTVVTLAALSAHMELIKEGALKKDAPFVLTHIDTGVENHLIQMLSSYEVERLTDYAASRGYNFDIRIGKPPLAKQWAALFLSGLKIISSARVNNDCAEIMKIDNARQIERSVSKHYNGQVVTLLGSRLSESNKRAKSLRDRNMDTLTAEDLVEYDETNERVFAPIINMSDEHVWTILRRAGTAPIQNSSCLLPNIPSYAVNHRLLHVIYSDSDDGSCPTSAKRIKGDKAQAGGCSGSARTGCFLCAKSIHDKSGEVQARQKRHAAISENILSVRNYIMFVAQDVKYRTWHSRAVDNTTNAVALQPNVLNAETIDRLIWLLCQATWDDDIRAQEFARLVAGGREMEDPGYADIMNDQLLSEEDRIELAYVYRKYAVRPLINPMSLELAVYLSAIHSRDGVKLPPYRALYVWDATSRGERIPYPDVDPSTAVIDDIPDAVMVIPSISMSAANLAFVGNGLMDSEHAEACDAEESKLRTTKVPVRIAKHYLPDNELHHLEGKSPSELISISGLGEIKLMDRFRDNPLKAQPKLRFSKRKIVKVSRKGGKYKVLTRGRTSLNTPSFGLRLLKPNLQNNLCTQLNIYMSTSERERGPIEFADVEDCYGYDIDQYAFCDWNQFDGSEMALNKHDEAIERYERLDDTIYHYGGTAAFEELIRWGVLKLNRASKVNALRILQRTAYFQTIGLFSIDDKAVATIARSTDEFKGESLNLLVSNYRKNIQHQARLNIDKVLNMSDYRSYKANFLWCNVRPERNKRRTALRNEYSAFQADPVTGAIAQLDKLMDYHLENYQYAVEMSALADCLKRSGVDYFDGMDIHNLYYTNRGFVNYFNAIFEDTDTMLSLFDKRLSSLFKSDLCARKRLVAHGLSIASGLRKIAIETLQGVLDNICNNTGQRALYFLISWKDEYKTTAEAQLAELIRVSNGVEAPRVSFKDTYSLSDTIAGVQDIVW